MRKLTAIITAGVFLLPCVNGANAASLNVSVTGVWDVDKTINTTNKITLGNSATVCSLIGSVGSINMGQNTATMSTSGTYYISIQSTGGVNASQVCSGQQSNYIIYKTSVDGIGISFNDSDSASQSKGQPVPLWPQLLTKFSKSGTAGIGTWVDIRLWKYSSAADLLPFGLQAIYAPAIVQGVGDGSLSVGCNTVSGNANNTSVCYTNRVRPNITTSIYSSSCQFVNASKTVQMGTHAIPGNAVQGYGARWVDASFQLSCPNAYGYNSDPTNTSAITKNSAVTVTVQPRNGVIDASNGIIKLDGTGAQGVGIQLAWGDYGNQNTTPSNPVKLNTPTNANTLSSNFASGPYAIGSNPVSGDGTIKMAARYIRTTGTLQPGPANAIVEILANYQ